MFQNNKIMSLALCGLILGVIVGAISQAGLVMAAVLGGLIGFLAGWFWNSRSSADTASESVADK